MDEINMSDDREINYLAFVEGRVIFDKPSDYSLLKKWLRSVTLIEV